jgi:hypothetical protein
MVGQKYKDNITGRTQYDTLQCLMGKSRFHRLGDALTDQSICAKRKDAPRRKILGCEGSLRGTDGG